MLYAENVETSYENFIAICPECGYRNIFNRRSDLKTTQPISSKPVQCFNESCRKTFGINGDRIQANYLTLLFDCYMLRNEKRYSTCVLLLAQSLEVFFYHYLKVELAYRPFWKDSNRDIDRVNKLLSSLESTVEELAYGYLKNVFINWVVNKPEILSLADSEDALNDLRSYIKKLKKKPLDNSSLKSPQDLKLADLLTKLKICETHKLRNKVVHKEAYRPEREEVDAAIKEVRELLVKLSHHLEVSGADINSYR